MNETDEFLRFRSALADRYAIDEEIGRGGMGVVYRAQDLRHDRFVAIKALEPRYGVAVGATRFLREIAIDAGLQHPNILPLFDSGQVDAFLFFVMPFADGGSLRDRLRQEKPLQIEEALRIAREVGDALAYAHRQGIVHRDVKPANILFSAGHAMVADFGIAHAVVPSATDRLTEQGNWIGTPAYMSPEQLTADQPLDPRSDLYSLACVVYEMLAGQAPFTGPSPQVIAARQITDRPAPLRVSRPDVPAHVAAAIERALAKQPAARYATIDAFLRDLETPGHAVRRPRRALLQKVAIGSLAAVALSTAWISTRDSPSALADEKVVVFPLASRGIGIQDPIDGTGVAYLIETALEGVDPLRLIDGAQRMTEAQMAEPGRLTTANARAIARDLGAAHYLTGVIQGHRDSTTVILRLHDVLGDSIVEQQSATGAIGTPLHHLGIDAVLGLLPALIDPEVTADLTELRDRKAAAIVLWWQAERAYRNSNFALALDLYDRALAEDSALAIAAIKAAQAASWLHSRDRGRELVSLALAREQLLPHRYVILARGLHGYFGGQPDSAVHWLEEAAERYPEWWEPAAALGEVYYHLLPSATPLDSLARQAFRRGLAGNASSPAMFHVVEAAIRDGNVTEASRLLERYRSGSPDPELVAQLTVMLACVNDPRAMQWDTLTVTRPATVLLAGKLLSVAGLQHECAEGAFRAVLRLPEPDPVVRWGAFLGLQGVLIATGRDGEARLLIDSIAARTGRARSLYVLNSVAGAGRMDEPAAALEAFARERFGADYEGVVNTESLWVLSVWLEHTQAHQQRDMAEQEVLKRGANDAATPIDRFFAQAITARRALAMDTLRAISLLQSLPSTAPPELTWGFGDALAPERILLARLLFARGQYRESIAAASVFDHAEPVLFLPYLPASLSLRYQAALELSDDVAAEHYRDRLQRLHRSELVTDEHQRR